MLFLLPIRLGCQEEFEERKELFYQAINDVPIAERSAP